MADKSELDREKLSSSDDDDDDDFDDGTESEDMIRKMIHMKLVEGGLVDKKENPKVLEDLSVEGIVKYIQSGKATKIITMAGAGISTSAGIPDFRSPGTGLYSNLKKYNLPDPQAIFAIDYFRKNPEPFYKLAKELYPDEDKFKPTPSHYFVKLLHDKGLLLRHYTQNIDTLERLAGIPESKLVEAHGTFHTAHCTDSSCRSEYSKEWVKGKLFDDDVIPTCEKCNSVVKPDIVFFGESLPEKFFGNVSSDLKKCDLLIVMGTSLTVQPFASLVDRVSDFCPRLLVNLEVCGTSGSDYVMTLMGLKSGFDFDSDEAYRDVAMVGKTDDSCNKLVDLLGWKDEFDKLLGSNANKSPTEKNTKSEEKEKSSL